MRRVSVLAILGVALLAPPIFGEGRQAITAVSAQSLAATAVSASGRLQAVNFARLSPRVSGHLMEFGRDAGGRSLDAGMLVKKGQMVFRLNETTYKNTQAAAEAMLASAKAGLENLTAKTREERLDALKQALAEVQVRVADKEKDFARYQRLVEVDKTLPAKRLEEVGVDLAALRTQQKAAEARLREAENGPTKSEIAVAEARVKEAEVALKTAGDDLRDVAVMAPFDGLITQRYKSVGDYIATAPPVEVLELVNLDQLEVEFRLPESYFTRVEAGRTRVRLTSTLLKAPLDVAITRVIGNIDPVKGTFACRTSVPDAGRLGLLPGAFVTADITLTGDNAQVIVPQGALIQHGNVRNVFVAEQGKMVQRVVDAGDRLTEGVIIKTGLQPGDRVLVGPEEMLRDGAALPEYLMMPTRVPASGPTSKP